MLGKFTETFTNIWNKHALIMSCHIWKNHTPWITGDVLELSQKCDTLYKVFLRSWSADSFRIYKTAHNVVTNAVRLAKRTFFPCGARAGCKAILAAY